MKIPVTFLGTSQAVPTATRNHTSILLEYGSEKILVDCGEGTQRQFRKARINPCKLNRILITHWHGDHVLGLPGLFQTLVLSDYNKTINIYGPKGTKQFVRELINSFIPVKKIKAKVYEVEGKFLETPDFIIEAISLEHGVPCNGYSFTEKTKLRIDKSKLRKLKIDAKDRVKLSELVKGRDIKINREIIKAKDFTYKQEGKKVSFIFDTKVCDNAKKLAKNSDLMIMEATYSKKESELALEYKHSTAGQAAKIAKQAKAKQLILTHISQRFEHKEKILLDEAKKVFKNTKIAEDLMRVEV